MVDPRISIIGERMKGIRNVVAVSGGKGGVGKSLAASTLALVLTSKKFRVGLFDMDFTSPSTHIILGIGDVKPKEEKGIIPPKIHGLEYMSIVYYTDDYATPLRGADISNALIELLSVTKWGNLDYLILDMPPGISDSTLDLMRLIKRIRFLIITTTSQLAFETVRKLVNLLETQRIPIIGVVENMKMTLSQTIQKQTEKLGLDFLAEIPYDLKIEEAIGDTDRLLRTTFAEKVERIASKI